MARPASGTNLTIAQLQRVLNEKKSELDRLYRQRATLEKKMNLIDRQIERVQRHNLANRIWRAQHDPGQLQRVDGQYAGNRLAQPHPAT